MTPEIHAHEELFRHRDLLVQRIAAETRSGKIYWKRVRPWYWYGAHWGEKRINLDFSYAHDGADLTLFDHASGKVVTQVRGFQLLTPLRDLINSLDPEVQEEETRRAVASERHMSEQATEARKNLEDLRQLLA